MGKAKKYLTQPCLQTNQVLCFFSPFYSSVSNFEMHYTVDDIGIHYDISTLFQNVFSSTMENKFLNTAIIFNVGNFNLNIFLLNMLLQQQ